MQFTTSGGDGMAHLTLTASFEYIRYIKRVCFVSVYKCQNGARLHDFFGPGARFSKDPVNYRAR